MFYYLVTIFAWLLLHVWYTALDLLTRRKVRPLTWLGVHTRRPSAVIPLRTESRKY